MEFKSTFIILLFIFAINCNPVDNELENLIKKFFQLGKPTLQSLNCENKTDISNDKVMEDYFNKCTEFAKENAHDPLEAFCKKFNSNLLNSITKYEDVTEEFQSKFNLKANEFSQFTNELKLKMKTFIEVDDLVNRLEKDEDNKLYKAVAITIKNSMPVNFFRQFQFNRTSNKNEIILNEFQNCDLELNLFSAVLTVNLKKIVFKLDENTNKFILDPEMEPNEPFEFRFEDCPTEKLEPDQFDEVKKPTISYFCFFKRLLNEKTGIFNKPSEN